MNNFDRQLNALFNKLEKKIDAVPNIVAETATELYKDSFRTKQWDGVPWEPYKNKAREPKRGSLMNRNAGGLVSTIKPSIVSAHLVRMSAGGRGVNYARVHNEGLRIRTVQYVRGYHNSNFMGKGKRVQVHPHNRKMDFKMPKRQFMGKSQPLLKAIKTRFNNHLKTL